MKIAIIGANGKEGKLFVKEALNKDQDVVAIVRNENQTEAEKIIQKDLFDLTKDDLDDFDIVIDSFGAWTPEILPLHISSLQHLCDILSGSNTRLLVVGGAGSLYLDKEHTKQLMDDDSFPEAFKPLALNMGKGLDELRKRDDVKWTYLSPAADFQADGKETGKYILGGEEMITNSKGESQISYKDYTKAMIDEALNGNHIKERISVVAE